MVRMIWKTVRLTLRMALSRSMASMSAWGRGMTGNTAENPLQSGPGLSGTLPVMAMTGIPFSVAC